jgi:hypothetical protein
MKKIALAFIYCLVFVSILHTTSSYLHEIETNYIDIENSGSLYSRGDNFTYISELIEHDLVFTTDHSPYYLSQKTSIINDSTLTIEPGVSVYFHTGAFFNIFSNYNGNISIFAHGTPENRIRFIFNESSGNDTPRLFSLASSNCYSLRYCDFIGVKIEMMTSSSNRIQYCCFYSGSSIRIFEDGDSGCDYGGASNNTVLNCQFVNAIDPLGLVWD